MRHIPRRHALCCLGDSRHIKDAESCPFKQHCGSIRLIGTKSPLHRLRRLAECAQKSLAHAFPVTEAVVLTEKPWDDITAPPVSDTR